MDGDEILRDVISATLHIGAVKWQSRWRFFAGTLGEWTFDYPSYDPSYQPSPDDKSFRGGLLCIDETDADDFCTVMKPYELQPTTIAQWVKEHGPKSVPLVFAADFDSRFFVHGYTEPIEPKSNYLAPGWSGIEDDPCKHVPPEVALLWGTE